MKLIKLSETHYIIVDNSKISVGDFIADGYRVRQWLDDCSLLGKKKVIYSTEPESLGPKWMQSVLPLLLSQIEEVLNINNVEKMALKNWDSDRYLEEVFEKESYCAGYWEGFKAHQELYPYSRNQVFELMCIAFKAGFEKYDSVKVWLEGLELVECAWILTKFDSTPKPTEWDVEFDKQGKLKLILQTKKNDTRKSE